MDSNRLFTRRDFIRQSTASVAVSAIVTSLGLRLAEAQEGSDKPLVRIGLLTDLHYADQPPEDNRHYRETPTKLTEAAKRFKQEKVHLTIELGDLINSEDSLEVAKDCLRRIAREFAAVPGQHHFVLGNHCVSALTKPEFLEIIGQKASYYSFDTNGVHFVILDACFRSDGEPYGRNNFEWFDTNIPTVEVEWLRADLKQTAHKTVVFVHQPLDVDPPAGIKNAPEVRKILADSGKVLAVLQGHMHDGDCKEIDGVRYVTLTGMVDGSGEENSAYAILDILSNNDFRMRGFRRQKSHDLK